MDQLGKSNKPLLVFLPGTLCTEQMFTYYLKSNVYDCICIRFNLESSLEQMAATVKAAVGERPFIPVGFSMGGMVAYELIRQLPEQVKGLILLCSNKHADLPERAKARNEQLITARNKGLDQLFRNVYLPIYFAEQQSPFEQQVIDMALELGTECFAAQLEVLASRPDSSETLKQFNKPALIIGAENDVPCPPQHQLEIHQTLPNSQLFILGQTGHFAPLEQAQLIQQQIILWLETNHEQL